MFQLFATGVVDTGSKFTFGVIGTDDNLPLVSLTNLPPYQRQRRYWWQNWGHWYRWCTSTCEYLHALTLMLFSGAWGKMIHEKNPKQKILWQSPVKHPYWPCMQRLKLLRAFWEKLWLSWGFNPLQILKSWNWPTFSLYNSALCESKKCNNIKRELPYYQMLPWPYTEKTKIEWKGEPAISRRKKNRGFFPAKWNVLRSSLSLITVHTWYEGALSRCCVGSIPIVVQLIILI